jgi:ribose 5-phosphate isomerase B
MAIKTIAIGGDHAGFPYKDSIKRLLEKRGIEVQDFGTHSPDSVDYPDFVHPVANNVENNKADLGIVLCGSGNGVAMTANKHQGIRAALCWKVEIAALARQHNNANVIAIPVRFVSKKMALNMVKAFLDNEFEGGRHARRVGKIACS